MGWGILRKFVPGAEERYRNRRFANMAVAAFQTGIDPDTGKPFTSEMSKSALYERAAERERLPGFGRREMNNVRRAYLEQAGVPKEDIEATGLRETIRFHS